MKRVFSLVLMLLMASFTYEASAQASRLIGSWDVDVDAFGEDMSQFDEMDMGITFRTDDIGYIDMEFTMTQPMDETTNMTFEMDIDLIFSWTLTGNTLELKVVDAKINLDELEFNPSSPELNAYVPMIKQMIEQQIAETDISDWIGTDNILGSCTVRFISDNIVELSNGDNVMRIVRD